MGQQKIMVRGKTEGRKEERRDSVTLHKEAIKRTKSDGGSDTSLEIKGTQVDLGNKKIETDLDPSLISKKS